MEETELARQVREIMKVWIEHWGELSPKSQAVFMETDEFRQLALIPREFWLNAIIKFQRREDILREARRLQKERENQDKSTLRETYLERKRLLEAKRDVRGSDKKRAKRASPVRASPVRYAEKKKASRRKYKFCCRTCNRSFFADEKPWPRCNGCQNDSKVVCVCSGDGCQTVFPGREVLAYCDRCEDERYEIRNSFHNEDATIWKTGRHSKGT